MKEKNISNRIILFANNFSLRSAVGGGTGGRRCPQFRVRLWYQFLTANPGISQLISTFSCPAIAFSFCKKKAIDSQICLPWKSSTQPHLVLFQVISTRSLFPLTRTSAVSS